MTQTAHPGDDKVNKATDENPEFWAEPNPQADVPGEHALFFAGSNGTRIMARGLTKEDAEHIVSVLKNHHSPKSDKQTGGHSRGGTSRSPRP